MIHSDIESLSPEFQPKFKAFLDECHKAGFDVRAGETKRELLTHAVYFMQGVIGELSKLKSNNNLLAEYHAFRKLAGIFDVPDSDALGKNITWTLISNHFAGNAADWVLYENGKPNWNPSPNTLDSIATIAEKVGIKSGHRWLPPKKDSFHVEL